VSDAPHGHVPVLGPEVVRLLEPGPGDLVVDCTAGRGGHAELLAREMGSGTLVLGDLDSGNLAYAAERVSRGAPGVRVIALQGDFRHLALRMRTMGLPPAKGVLADLGVSSLHLDDPVRGFSFSADAPLDMRLDPEGSRTAADLVATLSEEELVTVIGHLGEEPLARRIARKVAESRDVTPIKTTAQLALLVREAYGPRARTSRLHPATRTFMALRIAVNDELGALEGLLMAVATAATEAAQGRAGWLAPDARVAVISFHSLEDRLVKRSFAALESSGLASRLARKPLVASDAEVDANPRARSAKMRIVRLGSAQSAQARSKDAASYDP
jgi:16S rRNA (cytosine1402-N4)-methyltransferase